MHKTKLSMCKMNSTTMQLKAIWSSLHARQMNARQIGIRYNKSNESN